MHHRIKVILSNNTVMDTISVFKFNIIIIREHVEIYVLLNVLNCLLLDIRQHLKKECYPYMSEAA